MVQCDKCDQWYHYECVAVNSGVADVSWSCEGCNTNNYVATRSYATAQMERNPAVPNTIGQLRQPQASSSPTTTGETKQMASMITAGTSNGILSSTGVVASSSAGAQFMAKTTTSSAATNSVSFPLNNIQTEPRPTQPNTTFSPNVNLQLKLLEEQQRLQQEFLERKYKILSQMGDINQFHQIPQI